MHQASYKLFGVIRFGMLERQPKVFWVFVLITVIALGVIVVDVRAPDSDDVAIPETPGSTSFVAESTAPKDPSATIPGCDAMLAPDGQTVAFYQAFEETYDNPRYPWFSGRKATALSDALASALPEGTAVEFAAPGTSSFGTESALRFGPVQGPSSDSGVDDPSLYASSTAAGLLIRNGRGADVTVTISKQTYGVPPCVGGSLDRRQVLGDGTVVDVLESVSEGGGRTAVVRSVSAYAPDGTNLQIQANQFVSTDEAVSMDDLVSLASRSDLRIDAPIPPGTRSAPPPCGSRAGVQDGPPVTAADADRLGRALDHARVRALRAVVAFDQPLTSMQRGYSAVDTLCAAGTIVTPESKGVVSVSITGGQPLPKLPDKYDPAADRSVDTVALPDGSISERSKRGVRTVTVTRPSGTRVRISSTSAGELVTVANLESIATAPGLDL